MIWMRGNRYLRLAASLVVSVFFLSQAFSCCMANQRLGRFVLAWARHQAQAPAPAHSCCPTTQAASDQDASRDQAGCPGAPKGGCCIQDANPRVPGLASESAPLPLMLAVAFRALPPSAFPELPARPSPSAFRDSYGPPVYLATSRLLI